MGLSRLCNCLNVPLYWVRKKKGGKTTKSMDRQDKDRDRKDKERRGSRRRDRSEETRSLALGCSSGVLGGVQVRQSPESQLYFTVLGMLLLFFWGGFCSFLLGDLQKTKFFATIPRVKMFISVLLTCWGCLAGFQSCSCLGLLIIYLRG